MADQNTNTSTLNPNPIKNYTPSQFLPSSTTQSTNTKLFFDNQRYDMSGTASPENGFNAYPMRTPQYISNLFGNNNSL